MERGVVQPGFGAHRGRRHAVGDNPGKREPPWESVAFVITIPLGFYLQIRTQSLALHLAYYKLFAPSVKLSLSPTPFLVRVLLTRPVCPLRFPGQWGELRS